MIYPASPFYREVNFEEFAVHIAMDGRDERSTAFSKTIPCVDFENKVLVTWQLSCTEPEALRGRLILETIN